MKKICVLLICSAVAALVFSCVTSGKKSTSNPALQIALQDALTSHQNATVWIVSNGKATTYWIKNDMNGAFVAASRDDLVIPVDDALWRLENDALETDYDFVDLRDLMSGALLRISLDDSYEEGDAGADEDAGVKQASTGCGFRKVQGRPQPLGSVGAYLFLKFEEQTLNCKNERTFVQDRFVTVDLSRGEKIEILTDEEQAALLEKAAVKSFQKEEGRVSWVGSFPYYNAVFELTFFHVLSTDAAVKSADGQARGLVNILEVPDKSVPRKLKDCFLPSDLVRSVRLSASDELLGGFSLIVGADESVEKRAAAFAGF
jgi:hypothetical protein